MELNVFSIQFVFSFITFLTVLLGVLINVAEKYLPVFIPQLYRYGKFSYRGSARNWTLQVPKRWFKHFYVFGSLWSTHLFVLVVCIYLNYIESPPTYMVRLLDVLAPQRVSSVSCAAVFVASFLLTIQCWRRCYETCYVSVFSPGKMDVSHYLIGILHYFGAVSAIAVEAPGFSDSGEGEFHFRLKDLTFYHYIAMTVFLWAWIVQYDCACILANLRKNSKGEVVTVKHKIPQSGMFKLISCPHLFCEIVMYLCLTVILWGNMTFPFILIWVVSNQMETAMLSHWWYKENFQNYPSTRKAVIPFLL